MPRPPKSDSEKRQLIGARFSPEHRKQLVDYADAAGISPGAELEKRAVATLAFDEEGLELIAEIGAEIQAIQAGLGKRWHKDLKTWSAVMDMFRTGPMMSRNPDPAEHDDVVKEAYERYRALVEERTQVINSVSEIGLSWSQEPKFKAGRAAGGLLGMASGSLSIDLREAERKIIETIEDEALKLKLLELHEGLRALDSQIEDADKEWSNSLALYWNAESEGRSWNRKRQRDRAIANMRAGEPFNLTHLSASDPWDWKRVSPEEVDAA